MLASIFNQRTKNQRTKNQRCTAMLTPSLSMAGAKKDMPIKSLAKTGCQSIMKVMNALKARMKASKCMHRLK